MNLQVTFDPNNITSVDAALDLIERLHPTVLTDRARSKERRAAEQAALDEIANSGAGSWSIHLDGRSIALVHNPLIGQRLCDLLNRHGVADIPDHPGWPAPTGQPITTDKPTP